MPVDGHTKRGAAPASLSGSLATCAHESRDWGRRRGAPSGVTDLTGSAEVFAIGHGSRGRFAYCSAASTAKTALCAVRRLFAAHDKGWTDQCTVSFEREGFTVVAFHAADGMLVAAATAQLSQSPTSHPPLSSGWPRLKNSDDDKATCRLSWQAFVKRPIYAARATSSSKCLLSQAIVATGRSTATLRYAFEVALLCRRAIVAELCWCCLAGTNNAASPQRAGAVLFHQVQVIAGIYDRSLC